MEEDLKLAQHLARMHTNNSRSSSPAGGEPADGAAGDGSIKTHASMVLDKIQGFR